MEPLVIRKNIIQVLSRVYIFIDDTVEGDIDLETYIEDSIHFMSFVVELEQHFHIEFPPELLSFENFKTINGLVLIIEELLMLKS